MSPTGARLAALAALVALHLLAVPWAGVPGYLSVDEATYHWMAKSAAEGRGVELWNGYRERPSPELEAASIVAHGGRLVGRPPQPWAFLAAPFYRLAGLHGLVWLNALAFAGVLALTAWLGARLTGDRRTGLDAALLLALATFAWEYAVAPWPHMTALLLNLATFALALAALDRAAPRRAAALAAAAGLVGGLGLGVRLDLLFVLAAAALPPLFSRPWRPAVLAGLAAGALPGTALMAVLNRAKFGTWSPLSMGGVAGGGVPNLERYLGLAGVAAAAVALAWVVSRRPIARRLGWRGAAAAALVAALGVAAAPTPRRAVARELSGAATLVLDLRRLDPERRERAMNRGPGGGVVYIGALKKSLLQSCPWLVLAAVPLVAAARRRGGGDDREAAQPGDAPPPAAGASSPETPSLETPSPGRPSPGRPSPGTPTPERPIPGRRVALAGLVPALFVAFYAWSSWHGGLSLNQRYLLAALPYLAILAAHALGRLRLATAAGGRAAALAGGGGAVALFLAGRATTTAPAAQERLYLDTPLLLAAALALALTAHLVAGKRPHRRRLAAATGLAVAALAAAALVWASCVAFLYDYPAARRQRAFNLEVGRRTAELVRPDSILFSNALDKFYYLLESDRVRLARPSLDGFDDFEGLARFHLARGRGVYGAFGEGIWRVLAAGPLAGLEVRPLWAGPGFLLAEVVAPGTARSGGAAPGAPEPRDPASRRRAGR